MSDPQTPAPEATEPAAAPTKPSTVLDRAKRRSSGSARLGMEAWTFSIRDEVAELLEGSKFQIDSYLQNAYRVIEASADLRAATQQAGSTVLGAIMLGATLQLPIGGPLGQFYLTPRTENYNKPNERTVCVPMIGYRGFFELGYRSGLIRSFDYIVRREGDLFKQGGSSERGKWFEWAQFENGEFDELDAKGDPRPLTGVVALAHRFGASEPAWVFMSRATIEKRRPAYWKKTPWNGDNAEAMYIKTPHRELAKFQQLSSESARAVAADEAISYLNRQTGAIETLAPDQDAPHELDAGGNAPDAGRAGPGEAISDAVGVSTPQAPEAAQGRTAPQLDTSNVEALDLPRVVREQGRTMTDAEYERYSAAGGE